MCKDKKANRKIITKKIFKIVGASLLSLLILFCAFTSGAYLAQENQGIKTLTQREVAYVSQVTGYDTQTAAEVMPTSTDFNLYWNLWNSIKTNYVDKDKVKDNDLFYGSLKGMAASLNDPYTVFFDPKENKSFQDDLAGTFEGIGAEIGLKNDLITIISPLDGMPAAKAGLMAGDQILAINGTSTSGMAVDQAVKLIRGPKDTSVTLTIYRKGVDVNKDYKINRDTIIVKSVNTQMRADGLYVIKVSAFNDDTKGLFDQAVQDVLKKNPKGLILDLRNDPGGYLDTAVAMASEWVEKGAVVWEKFSNGNKSSYNSNGAARLTKFKTVVLINGGSASASEIVSGALRDYKKATLIGEKSFGKGSVQSVMNFADGSALKVTIAKWLTPNGDCINELGIKPTQEVKLTLDDFNKNKDPQMDAAVNFLLGKTVKATIKTGAKK